MRGKMGGQVEEVGGKRGLVEEDMEQKEKEKEEQQKQVKEMKKKWME